MTTHLTNESPRVLLIDIEMTPIVAHAWELWKVNISLPQIIESARMLCFAAKWLHDPEVMFYSEWEFGHDLMVYYAHTLLAAADVVIHYNGTKFDVPHLNREFLQYSLGPPAPFRQIDLYTAIKKQFRFPSNKMDYVLRTLGFQPKLPHEGHALWVKCMNGEEEARETMRDYNVRDVVALGELYDEIRAWIPGHPNMGLYMGNPDGCPKCGGSKRQRRGWAYTLQGRYVRYRCDCGAWYQDVKRDLGASVRSVAA